MKININGVIEGQDIIKLFNDVLAKQGITAKSEEIKFFVSKDNKDIEITPDRLKVVFNRE